MAIPLADAPLAARVAYFKAAPKRGARIPRSNDKAPLFLAYWKLAPETKWLPKPEPEYHFARSIGREFRFDWAWPALFLAVEIDGGRWAPGGGRHGSDEDRSKLNHAASLSWRVFRFSPAQLAREAPTCIAMVATTVRTAIAEKRGEVD